MLSDNDQNKVWVHLFNGEQDGFRKQICLKTKPPVRFYIWHINDYETIDKAKGKDRMVLQNRFAVMAYELFGEPLETPDGPELRYRRCETADKVTPNPAV